MAFHDPQKLLGALAHAYYEERSLEGVLSCMTDDVEWVGTEARDHVNGKAALKALLLSDFSAMPADFRVELGEPTVRFWGEAVALVTVTGAPRSAAGYYAGVSIRGTLCCVKTGQGWLVSQGHTSVPSMEMEKASLQSALAEEREKLKALLDNVPGGVAMYRLKKDGRIPADYVSDGLARICGYRDGDDIMRVMGVDSRRLVYPEDYPVVAAACQSSLEKGVPTSIQYRVYAKDGHLVPLTLDSVIMRSAALGEEDVAVFYAVQTLVSEESSKKAEEQAALLTLLNTVPAGIGIFEVNRDGISQDYLNDAFYRLIDTKREDRTQYVGRNALTTAHPTDVSKLQQAMQQMLDGADSAQLDYRVKGGRGLWVWLHLSASVVERDPGCIKVYAAFYECTESKRQQLQLLQNQEAVTLAEKQGRLCIWTFNIDKRIIAQHILDNQKGHMGYPAHIDNVPDYFVEGGYIHPEDIDKYTAVYQKLTQGEEKVDELFRLLNKTTGKFDWTRMYYQRMANNDDGDRMAVGFSIEVNKQQDAVERYQTEQKLREQMYASAVIYMEYNLTRNEYVGKNNLAAHYLSKRWEFSTEDDFREHMESVAESAYLDEVVAKLYIPHLLQAFARGEVKVSCEYRSKARPDLPSRWYRITAVMVSRPDTGDVMAFVFVEDIEEEKDRLLAIESSLSDGIENVASIRLADRQAFLLQSHSSFIPHALGKQFLYDDVFVNQAHLAVVSDEAPFGTSGESGALLSTVLRELENREVYQYSVTTKRKNHPAKRQLFRFRYLDDRKTHVVLSVSDITSLYLEEQAKKRQLEAALREAQQASHAKAEFYSRMSHDMRTPMNGILGMASLSKTETDSAVLKENIEKIQESGEYLLSLINDTLDIQRIESGKMKLEPSIVNITDVVRNILEMINVAATAKGVQLKYDKGNADLRWYVRVDALRLKQIFINLLSNAVKFTPPGGTVEFSFRLLAREGMVSHDVVYVRDTGIGMSEAFLKTGIFKPFSQENNAVSANYAGSGLGLSIAKSLVELMGGRIEVESKLGLGTTFAVYLDFERVSDVDAGAALQSEQTQTRAVSAQLQGRRILLAEDHPLNAEIARKLLQKVGCEVTWAQNGQEAVTLFADAPVHTYDAVLMDIRMPVMDGLEATRRLRASGKADAAAIPIIAMTANAYAEDVHKATDAGMNDYLAKPVSPEDLYATLSKHIL